MCRVMGIVGSKVSESTLFEKFKVLAIKGVIRKGWTEGHKDGWGIAGYMYGKPVCFDKSIKNPYNSKVKYKTAYERASKSGSEIIIAHLRKASVGNKMKIGNIHPFVCGKWVFCHNGTVYNSDKIKLRKYRYEGQTDSERIFKYIIEKIGNARPAQYVDRIKKALAEIKRKCKKYTSMLFLLSDGENLIISRDYFVRGEDEYYTLYISETAKGTIVCSEKLKGYKWKPVKRGEIKIIKV